MEFHSKVNTRHKKGNNIVKNIAEKSRNDFPLFNGDFNNNLIYLDHAATSQKPQEVIDSLKNTIAFKTLMFIEVHIS